MSGKVMIFVVISGYVRLGQVRTDYVR